MKYLQDDQLAQWTSSLTEVPVGNSRILHGRLEAYSMKRVSSDKKYAAVLGEKYVEQIHQDQEEWAATQQQQQQQQQLSARRKRSQSAGLIEEAATSLTHHDPPTKRSRSCSLDERPVKSLSALGDFNEQGTRRLMTDLVLTLNLSFPDYDFESIKPTDFTKLTLKKAINRINEGLSEWATSNPARHDLNKLWDAIDQSIGLKQCDVFSFSPSEDAAFLLATDSADLDEEEFENNDGHANSVDERNHPDRGMSGRRQAVLWSFYYLFINKHRKRIILFSCAESMHQTVSLADDDEEHDATVERFVPIVSDDKATADSLDFDWDPESTAAGGIPVSTI